ncbi:hypothetical protein MAR_033506 [Mya arenaria]|uniref:Uncharacterized protein n=1 Tax=Mya arenaria TaxID=6604 RepID=A0ABY7GBU7_MYAAR|nr:hypothetical protein MAR_033506 [Mya arenaria]
MVDGSRSLKGLFLINLKRLCMHGLLYFVYLLCLGFLENMAEQRYKTDVCHGEVPGRMPSAERMIYGINDDCVAGHIISDVCDGEVLGQLLSPERMVHGKSDDCVAGRILSVKRRHASWYKHNHQE